MGESTLSERTSLQEVPWIVSIPARWKAARARHLFRVTSHPVREGDEVVTCFRDGEVTLRRNRREGGFMVAMIEAATRVFSQGNSSFTRWMPLLGRSAYLTRKVNARRSTSSATCGRGSRTQNTMPGCCD